MDTIEPVSDADFDSYWEEEAKNKNRNRIRVGRQYQATVPDLLKPGEDDGRDQSELETLLWKPGAIEDDSLKNYLCVAKTVKYFSTTINNQENPSETLKTALKGLAEYVNSHYPNHHDAGCCNSKTWSSDQTKLFSQTLEVCGQNVIIEKTVESVIPQFSPDTPSTSQGLYTQEAPEPAQELSYPSQVPTIKNKTSSSMGVLSFHKEGQIMLELVAHKNEDGTCKWVESMEANKTGMCKKKLSQEYASVYPPVEIVEREEDQQSSRDDGEESASKKNRIASWSPAWTSKEEGEALIHTPNSALKCEHCNVNQELSSPKLKGKSSCDFTRASRPSPLKHGILSKMLSSPLPCNHSRLSSPTATPSRKEESWTQPRIPTPDKASPWIPSYYELYKCLPFYSSLYPSDIPLDLSSASNVNEKMNE